MNAMLSLKKMLLYKIFFLFCVICYIKTEEDDHKRHEHGHKNVTREMIFEEIFEHLNTTIKDAKGHGLLSKQHFKSLFHDYLYFRTCNSTEESNNCNLCFSSNDYLKWNKIDGKRNYSEEEFRDLASGIIYLLTPLPSKSNIVCKTFIANSTANENTDFFHKIQEKYGHTINEEAIEKILEDINKTIGAKLKGEQCFSVHDVIKGANVSESNISEADFKFVSGFIIWKLADGNCIKHEGDDHKKHVENLPKPNFFVDEIFEEFGGVNGSGITHEKFEEFYKKLSLGSVAESGESTSGGDHSGHEHHRRRRSTHDHFKKCYTGEQILSIYSVKDGTTINQAKFQEICPSLVQQIESGVCKAKTTSKTSAHSEHSDGWKPWVASIISIFIISLGSLSGVVTLPISKKKWFPFLLITLMSLAVAVMIGDAVVHLFPHALNLHGHKEGSHAHAHGSEEGNPLLEKDSYISKSLLLLLGVYLFFMFEMFMHSLGAGHTHSQDQKGNDVIPNNYARGSIQLNETKSVICVGPNGIHGCRDEGSIPGVASEASLDIPKKTFNYQQTKPQYQRIREFQTIVWMILLGDGIHNFLDGVAIGVAFSEEWPSGYHGGISTSIAILAHEVPHELGDFAVLLNSGLSVRQALVMNFLSSLVSFIGGFIGVALGTEWQASSWIFAITAGLFIYIALVDMLPEVLHSQALKTHPLKTMFLANVGLIVGFVIMFVLGAWEEDIKTVLK